MIYKFDGVAILPINAIIIFWLLVAFIDDILIEGLHDFPNSNILQPLGKIERKGECRAPLDLFLRLHIHTVTFCP